jgi:hypothetical protein
MNNTIELYQNNSTILTCTIVGGLNLTWFNSHLTVKTKASDTVALLSKDGFVSDPSTSVVFYLTSTDTSLNAGSYVYDIVIDSSTQLFTIVKDSFIVLNGVKY